MIDTDDVPTIPRIPCDTVRMTAAQITTALHPEPRYTVTGAFGAVLLETDDLREAARRWASHDSICLVYDRDSSDGEYMTLEELDAALAEVRQ